MERLYEVSEYSKVRFVGYCTESARYDFGFIYTNQFYGKPLVICMQTGKSALLCAEDTNNLEYLQYVFRLSNLEEAEELSSFFKQHLPGVTYEIQYE